MNLLHTDSGRVVLTKTTENNENISANSWQLNIKKPDSKINSTFVRNTERAIYEIADEISKATFGKTVGEYKEFKGLERENSRDHMNDLELIFTMPKKIEYFLGPKNFVF